jgi:1-acyl-sn-glycerol-3-phosphate acyltransferase
MVLWFNWRMEGLEQVPAEGPVIAACNHVSYLDPLCHGLFLIKAGRRPRFLAKSELYQKWFMRQVLTGAKQIPVRRGTGELGPVEAATGSLARDECVVIYPEATLTRNPDYSPMQGKTGVARIALASSAPIVPIAVWGSHRVLPRKDEKKDFAFGRPIMVKAGPPMDLSLFDGDAEDPQVLREATDAVMDELSRLVAELRTRYPKRWA